MDKIKSKEILSELYPEFQEFIDLNKTETILNFIQAVLDLEARNIN